MYVCMYVYTMYVSGGSRISCMGVKNCSEGRHVIAHFKDKFASNFNYSTSIRLYLK